MIRRVSLCAAAIIPMFTAANAGDLSGPGGYKGGPDVPVDMWSGFYIGANAGYGWNLGQSSLNMNGTAQYVTSAATSTTTTSILASPLTQTLPPALCTTTGTLNAGATAYTAPKNCDYPYTFTDTQALSDPAFGGGQIGYNVQRGAFVYGVEADFQGAQDTVTTARLNYNVTPTGASTAPGSSVSGDNFTVNSDSTIEWMGTLRARLGYAYHETTLIYFTGGLAFGGAHAQLASQLTQVPTGPLTSNGAVGPTPSTCNVTTGPLPCAGTETQPGSYNKTLAGFVLGAGFEHALSPSWSVKWEYQYIDLGKDTLTATASTSWTDPNSASPFYNQMLKDSTVGKLVSDYSYQTLRIGLNYHLHADVVPLK